MRVYRMVLMFIDHDDIGPDEAVSLIENARLPNHAVPGVVIEIDERDCGEWRDDHPLNSIAGQASACAELFGGRAGGK